VKNSCYTEIITRFVGSGIKIYIIYHCQLLSHLTGKKSTKYRNINSFLRQRERD